MAKILGCPVIEPPDPLEDSNGNVDVFGKYVKQYLDRVLPDLVAAAQGARGDASS